MSDSGNSARLLTTEVPVREARPRTGGTVCVENVLKNYGSVEALRSVSLSIEAGEFVSLLGPSGSGKSSLLNVIAGFEDADGGDVAVNGESILGLPAHKRGLGMVFQSYALFPNLSVAENVAYPLRIRGVAKAERRKRVLDCLELVELASKSERRPAELSGGEQQRVSLARALVFKPEILLMDEPLGALDRRLRQSLQIEIKRLHESLGMTVIYVTHDQDEALSMSDRIAVMRDGRIEQVGSPEDVYNRPETSFVASFLGETNLWDVAVEQQHAGGAQCVFAGETVLVPGVDATGIDRAQVSIRPDHLSFVAGPEGGVRVEVESRMFMGTYWRYDCLLGQGAEVVVHVPLDGSELPQVGGSAWISVKATGAVLLPTPEVII